MLKTSLNLFSKKNYFNGSYKIFFFFTRNCAIKSIIFVCIYGGGMHTIQHFWRMYTYIIQQCRYNNDSDYNYCSGILQNVQKYFVQRRSTIIISFGEKQKKMYIHNRASSAAYDAQLQRREKNNRDRRHRPDVHTDIRLKITIKTACR